MNNEEWINMFINKFNESKDYKITDVRDREKLLDDLIPTGEWIEHYDSSDGFTWLSCSRCIFKAYEDDYNFCPNCGARIRKAVKKND